MDSGLCEAREWPHESESVDIEPTFEDLLTCWGHDVSEENLLHYFPKNAVKSSILDKVVEEGIGKKGAPERIPKKI